ncbi:High-affnity carbon uptake protein Hat/HatR [Myxococcus llanfairpwllgwyngyllgogerychwyrndrobwllllantysiliogogogochensis]|uniref:High-affnity carbon uptake protein Hat/HatR n=1 Tax=Myxococcus llanfairpwllgwyngyllgogerychwyrndrobwllllantysiliogogogochensis TaxID=2590453 RepID=A0A540WRT0_9BACT|nr:WD40 repeat domain-containing protein [Myxococcus llanfairpwllgwyngyllgogerychwyrndrobwllllantysiliogogogochensis]TQF11722.1 High-affnity carbon uptake protein Hat/HatR [Myxococcus llanfairpwllgwyngyllgogerychwyrndrobwllllantysiliogogogochensis]
MPQDLASLTELSTLEALIDAEGVDGLLAALTDALARTRADTRVLHEDGPTVGPRTLGVLRKAVTLDADFLREHPETLFQCLYNRLRWYDAPDAARHFSVTGQGPWDDPEAHLHQLAAWWRRQRESSGGAPWVESLLPLRGALEGADAYLWHESQVLCTAFDATGTRLATGSYTDGSRADGNNVHVWDVATGKQLRVMEGHEMEVRGIAWSPDGKQLASGSRAHEARVWDVETGEHLHLFRRQEGQVTSVAFSPDGTLLAVANLGWLIHLYDLDTGEKVRTLKGHQQSVLSVAFHPSGRWLVSGASDDTMRVWEVATGEQVARLDAQRSVSTVAFSPDGEWLAWADLDDVGVAETKTWQRVRGIQGGSRYSHVQWLGSSRLGLLGYDRLEVLDVKDGASVWSRPYSSDGHERGAAFSPDLKHFALTAVDGGVLLSRLDAPTPPRLLSEQHRVKHLWGRTEGTLAVAMRMDGMLAIDAQGHVREPPPETNASNLHPWRFSGNDALAAYPVTKHLEDGWRRGIQLFDLARLAPTMELTGKPLEGRDASRKMTMKQVMTFSPDTTLLAGTFELGVVRVWRVADGQLLHTFKGPEAPVTMVEFTPDGAYVVSGHEEPSRLQVHDVKTGRLVLDTQALMKPAVAYTAAEHVPRIAVGRASGDLELFDLSTGFRRLLQVSEEPVITARLSEDGLRVAVCALDDRVRMYEADTGRLMYEIQHPALPFLVAMDGDVLVTRSDDQKTRFFDLATGAPREVLDGSAEPDEVTRRTYWEVLSDEPVAFHRRMDTTPLARFHDSLEEAIILRDGLVVARGLTVPDFLYVLKLHDASGEA